jgi:hypothetical protein
MFVQPTQVALANGYTMTIKEFEDFDRYFPAVAKPITKLRGGELTSGGGRGDI